MLICTLARTPARVLACVLCCSAGSMHFHGSPSIGYSQFTACSVFVPPSLVQNQAQAARLRSRIMCLSFKRCNKQAEQDKIKRKKQDKTTKNAYFVFPLLDPYWTPTGGPVASPFASRGIWGSVLILVLFFTPVSGPSGHDLDSPKPLFSFWRHQSTSKVSSQIRHMFRRGYVGRFSEHGNRICRKRRVLSNA